MYCTHSYLTAHFGASPSMKGADYIFHCHPVEQKIPTAKRLISWCRSMLDKGKSTGVVYDYRVGRVKGSGIRVVNPLAHVLLCVAMLAVCLFVNAAVFQWLH